MPRDLPGMYWDEEKRRYFPLTHTPAGAPRQMAPLVASTATAAQLPKRSSKRKLVHHYSESPPPQNRIATGVSTTTDSWRALNKYQESFSERHRRIYRREIQTAYVSNSTTRSDSNSDRGHVDTHLPLDVGQLISALCTRGGDEDSSIWIGDTSGWLCAMNTEEPESRWREFFLGTQITSITRSRLTTLVTSLGSPARAIVTRGETVGLWLLREFPQNLCDDVWCGHVCGRKIVLGGRRGAMCFPDLERDDFVRLRCATSDVLSAWFQNQDLMYVGLRNGIVQRWDVRQPDNPPDAIVNMSLRKKADGGAPVQHLRTIHQHGLLVETMRGDLEVHDLRYMRNTTPILRLEGHVSSYQIRPGLTIDREQNFVFAGGGDSRLRAWSLRTGQPLHSGHVDEPRGMNPFRSAYSNPIRALEIVLDEEKTHMWVGYGSHLDRLTLGPNGILC